MTSSLDVRQKQRAVIEFLVSEGEPPKQIFERLVNVYGDASLAYSTVKKWVSRIKHEEDDPSLSSLQDRPRSGRPSSAVNPGNNDKVEKLIRDDRRITIDDIGERVGVSHGSAVNIVNELGQGWGTCGLLSHEVRPSVAYGSSLKLKLRIIHLTPKSSKYQFCKR